MSLRAILLVSLAAFLFAGTGRAGDAPGLPGGATKPEEAALQCDSAFVGRITKDGRKVGGTMGSFGVEGLEVAVLQIFRGTPSPRVTVTYSVLIGHEEAPKFGRSYLFFVKKWRGFTDPYVVVKLLPSSRNNIVLVKKLISNR